METIYKSFQKFKIIFNNSFPLFCKIRLHTRPINSRDCRLGDISSRLFRQRKMKKLRNCFISLRNALKGEREIKIVRIILLFKNCVKAIKKELMNCWPRRGLIIVLILLAAQTPEEVEVVLLHFSNEQKSVILLAATSVNLQNIPAKTSPKTKCCHQNKKTIFQLKKKA